MEGLAEAHAAYAQLVDISRVTGDMWAAIASSCTGMVGGVSECKPGTLEAWLCCCRELWQQKLSSFWSCFSSISSANLLYHLPHLACCREQLYRQMEQLLGDGLDPPFSAYVFSRLLKEGRHAELLDLPPQVGDCLRHLCQKFCAECCTKWLIRDRRAATHVSVAVPCYACYDAKLPALLSRLPGHSFLVFARSLTLCCSTG